MIEEYRPTDPDVRQERQVVVHGVLFAVVLLLITRGVALFFPGHGGASAYALTQAPPAAVEEAANPLGTPVLPPFASNTYSFMQTQNDGVTPVTWDPCRPIHYVMNPANAPADANALVSRAVAQISAISGLQIIDDGSTTEVNDGQRQAFQPQRYGRRWAPVLITWDPQLFHEGREVAGLGGPLTRSTRSGTWVHVSGQIELSASQLLRVSTWPGGQDLEVAVIEHEWAHVLGLDHVNADTELMNSGDQVPTRLFSLGPGDVNGLVRMGSGPCHPDI